METRSKIAEQDGMGAGAELEQADRRYEEHVEQQEQAGKAESRKTSLDVENAGSPDLPYRNRMSMSKSKPGQSFK